MFLEESLLKPLLLDGIQVTSKLIYVTAKLSHLLLVHVKLGRHGLHLHILLSETGMIQSKLLGDLWTGLAPEYILQLDVESFFLLDAGFLSLIHI